MESGFGGSFLVIIFLFFVFVAKIIFSAPKYKPGTPFGDAVSEGINNKKNNIKSSKTPLTADEIRAAISKTLAEADGTSVKTFNSQSQRYKKPDKVRTRPETGRTRPDFGNSSRAEHMINHELSDANLIWMQEQAKMNNINNNFNKEMDRMHSENEKLIREAQNIHR